MTRIARPVTVAAAAALLGAACASAIGIDPQPTTLATTTSTTAPGTISGDGYGGTAVIGLGEVGSPRTLNPLLAGTDTETLDVVRRAVGATAYRVDPVSGALVPHLVLELPSFTNGGIVDDGGGVVSVNLRVDPEARWSDGARVTGDDFVFTFEVISDLTLPIREDVRSRYAHVVPGSMGADGAEVSFRARADTDIHLLFDIVIPRHQIEGTDFIADWNEEMWVSAGPFAFQSWEPDEFLELRRNQEYWVRDDDGDLLPYLDRVVFRFFDVDRGIDPRIETSFRGREIDVLTLPTPLDTMEDYLQLESRGAAIATGPSAAWYQLNFQFGPNNRNSETLNRHLEFRRAVAYAIDRDELAAALGTRAQHGFVTAYRPDLDDEPWSVYERDEERVAGLLFELGERLGLDLFAGDGPRLVLTAPAANDATVDLAGRIIVMLREAGIGAELQLEESALFFGATIDDGTWDVGAWTLPGGTGTAPAIDVTEFFDPDGLPFVGTNVFRWGTIDSTVQDPITSEYADLIDRLRAAIDPNEIDPLLLEAEQMLAENMVFLPIAPAGQVAVVWWGDEVTGPAVHPLAGIAWNVETWQRQPE